MTDHIPVHTIDTLGTASMPATGKIHTRSFSGRYRNLRLLGAGFLFLLFFGTAWVNWNGRQAVLWDLSQRQFHIFGATFWPQDFILLSALLIIAAFGLFTITVLAGRAWCGYACPQSVWTWIFMRIERLTEGERNQRIKLDAAPWSLEKLARRSAKHALWLLVSLATAVAFIGYFTPVRALLADLLTFEVGATTAFWLMFFTLATYINAGWLREKVCRDMCPYSRFQSVMFDSDTLIVTYDAARGENRGPRRKDSDYRNQGLGDCVDCTICVQVCPTGIDIRNGLQLDCISCGACIDACDDVMDRLGYPRGLVRYSSERELAGGRTHWFRPRLIGYAALLVLMIGSFSWTLVQRPLVSLDVARDRTLFRENPEGRIENIYTLKVINKTQQPRAYELAVADPQRFELHGPRTLNLAPGEIHTVPVSLALLADSFEGGTQTVHFEISDRTVPDSHASTASTFLGPRR